MKTKRKTIYLLVLLLFVPLVVGCSSKVETKKQETATPQQTVDWPFYEIRQEEEVVGYLLGSIHFGDPSMYPFPTSLIDKLNASTEVLSEVPLASLTSEMAVTQNEKYSQQEPHVLDLLTDDEKTVLEKKLSTYGLRLKDIEGLSYLGLEQKLQAEYLSAQDALNGVEMRLHTIIKENSLPNDGLETIGEQYRLLSQAYDHMLNDDQWIEKLLTLDEATASNQELLDVYIQGKLEENYQQLFIDSMDAEVVDTILIQRNLNWLEPLKEKLTANKQTFIVVGAGHLYGEEGLIRLLTNEQYQVEKVAF